MSQYIGKTISLISNKGLRYVGLLDNINADDATVALKSVRLFGTEGRMAQSGNPNLEVPPGTDVYEYVVFRGSDVKDLTVMDDPIDQVQPSYPAPQAPQSGYYQTQGQPQTSQPAQTQSRPADATTTQAAPAQTSTSQAAPPAPSQEVRGPPAPTGTSQAPHSQRERPEPTKTSSETASSTQNQAQPAPGSTPEHREPKPRSRVPAQPQPQAGPGRQVDVPDTAFDFESANAKFSRDQEAERDAEHTSYNKSSSFFDTISSSTEERNSMRWSEEKNLNIDTFGEASIQTDGGRGRGRGRGRGGWRGGRGNWRGGRGGNGGRSGRGNSRNDDYNTKPEWA